MSTTIGTNTTNTNNKEEKLRIAKHFLLSSPPGQFHLIAHDLHTIMMLQSNSMHASSSLVSSNSKQQKGSIPNATSSVSMRGDASVGNMSRTSRATTVRSSTGAGAVVEPLWSSEWLSEVQSAWERKLGNCGNDGNNNDNDDKEESPLYQCLQGHIKKHYSSKGVNAHVSLVPNENTSQVDILLYAERIQLSSSHVASWMGKFTYTPSKSNTQLSGQIQLRGHTFESGTVQSHYTSRPFCETIPSLSSSGTTSLEESIPSLIAKWEQEVLDNVNQLYGELSSSILKQVRRILPVTRTKMDWNVQAVRLVQSMEQDVSRREES